MELIFLDIDGVLNEIGNIGNRITGGLEEMIDGEKVSLLKKEVYNKRDSLYTVISSSWRTEYDVGKFKKLLPGFRVIDKIGDGKREEEIKSYVENQKYLDAWVVLDDEQRRFSDIKPHCVFTRKHKGVTLFDAEDVYYYLAHATGESFEELEEKEFS